MNDPNKRIDVNVSSLLSLKAELLRKQEEVNKAKNSNLIQNFVPKKIQKPDSKITVSNENTKTKEQTYTEYEESAQLAKSKQVLLAKSKLYDKMIKSGGTLNSDDNCLVMFNQKQQDYKSQSNDKNSSEDDFTDDDEDKYTSNNPDDEWVEYTDCLGRTRKCMRKDLKDIKKKDLSLADEIQPRQEPMESPKWVIDTKGETIEDEDQDDELVNNNSENDLHSVGMRQYQMRMQWEKQEKENMNKDYVHYQDILFDEARTHGVGFYEFSTDETERAKQRKEFDTLRTETLVEQKKRDEQKKIREKLIAERVKAAKNRQRQRQGLPPEEEDKPITEELYDKAEEMKKKELEEMEKREKLTVDKKREKERKNHVRPWDEGKQQDYEKEWKLKVVKEPMSQEQWNTKKRDERPKNFAPIYDEEIINQNHNKKTFNDLRRNKEILIRSELEFEPLEEEKKSLFFTSKKNIVKKTNQLFDNKKSIPIHNELSDNDDDKEDDDRDIPIRAEFAPPPTYDYYGPSSSKQKKTIVPSKLTLEKSIEAGLKFLRNQSDKDTVGSKRKWTTNADY